MLPKIVFTRVRRALRTGFNNLTMLNQVDGFNGCIFFYVGESAKVIDNFLPDTAYFCAWASARH
ncbi:hypothetical protein PDIG_53770 [Penicillium digitatum PHI26]|uniref:Uncharacterized protein n=2 Tax=Penicillium digitatum TaxID=36651 RepID=K9FNY6_PEND2|nr:hypothetical protein PDIP_48990 [Penicillium digitatum Pd1]EKV10889.1 hypothetical protein PDIG_53770 [Penicillium digitatum PHI26]EKV13211.1 hypothetical protein PDIP_48990 [Penicillium digitatum Pd1]